MYDTNGKKFECLVAAGSREDMTFAAEESKDESGETRIYPDDKFRPEGTLLHVVTLMQLC